MNTTNSTAVNRELSVASKNESQTVKVETSEMRYVYGVLACATLIAIFCSAMGWVK